MSWVAVGVGKKYFPLRRHAPIRVSTKHERFFLRVLEIFQSEGWLKKEGIRYTVIAEPSCGQPQQIVEDLGRFQEAYASEIGMVHQCGQHLSDVLQGTVDVLKFIFPDGSLRQAETFYQDSISFRFYNTILGEVVKETISEIPRNSEIRILEVGGGTGGLTSYVLPHLPSEGTEYVYSDVSPLFLSQAKEKFRDYPFLSYRAFDIEKEATKQGFAPQSFDLILASDVLHATRQIHDTLRSLQTLLAPSGQLIFLETTRPTIWVDLVFGLTEGWWRFSDLHVRSSHPLLTIEQWKNALSSVGFKEIAAFYDTTKEACSQSVFLAQGNEAEPRIQSEEKAPQITKPKGNWIIFADNTGVAEEMEPTFAQSDCRYLFVRPQPDHAFKGEHWTTVDPTNAEDMQQLIRSWCVESEEPLGILHFWSLDSAPSWETSLSSLKHDQGLGCESVLHLVKALVAFGEKNFRGLWLFTKGAQSVTDGEDIASVSQTSLWGMGRVISSEHPELRSCLIELDPNSIGHQTNIIWQELSATQEPFEDEVAFRSERRYVHRLTRPRLQDFQGRRKVYPNSHRSQAFELTIDQPGNLDSLSLRESIRRSPNPHEVEIQVHAAGQNFKDIMVAMGKLPEEATDGSFTGRTLGIECAGTVVNCGADVREFQPGDHVLGFAPASFGSYTTTPSDLVVHKLPRQSFEEAASIPVNFVTAYYALEIVARLSPGERILIHAGTGGVGLAAIQIAQTLGVEIYATAGNSQKLEFLRSLGIHHVMNSRSLDFVEVIKEQTDGKGVDVVLNSLSGEFVEKSLKVLGSYGRFIEIGKTDIYSNTRIGLGPFRKNLSYTAVDIDRLLVERPKSAGSVLRKIIELMNTNKFSTVPIDTYPIGRSQEAFRQMSQAKHIGKIVLSVPNIATEVLPFKSGDRKVSPDGTYLITGGLGGFGMAIGDWLIQSGAKNIVLMGRSSKPTPEAEPVFKKLMDSGATISIMQGDVSNEAEVRRVIDEIPRNLPPLRGIVHAAMVLDDGVLIQLNTARFRRVMDPKILGAWNLHTCTANHPLDFFVLFSSGTTLFGNSGQANYVAANAFLGGLAKHLRAHGVPATAICWGALGQLGYVSRHTSVGQHLERQGLESFTPREALDAFSNLLCSSPPEIGAMRQNWNRWSHLNTVNAAFPKFTEVLQSKDDTTGEHGHTTGESATQKRLKDLLLKNDEKPNREATLIEALRDQAAKALDMSAEKLDVEQSLISQGFDSLMVVDLQTWTHRELGVEAPLMDLMKGLTISQLASRLLVQLDKHGDGAIQHTGKTEQGESNLYSENVGAAVSPEFRGWVKELNAFFQDMDSQFEKVSRDLNNQSLDISEAQFPNELRDLIPSCVDRLLKASYELGVKVGGLSEEEHPPFRDFYRSKLHSYFLQSPYCVDPLKNLSDTRGIMK